VQAAAGGTQATTVLEGDRLFGLTVRLKPEYRSSLDAVRSIMVGYSTPGGANAYISLRELASITLDTGASYYHESNERYIPVKFSVRGRDLGSTVADAEARIRGNVKLPQGYRIKWAGEFEELRLAQHRLEIVAPIAIGAILLLLYMLFNSLRDSLLTLAGMPFFGRRQPGATAACHGRGRRHAARPDHAAGGRAGPAGDGAELVGEESRARTRPAAGER